MIGITKPLQTVTGVDILAEKKLGSIHEGDDSLDDADFRRSGFGAQF
jgi:hypothetical protein